MLGMGWSEIFLVVIVVLFAVGPEKLPDVARGIARLIRQVQHVVGELRDTVNLEELDAQVRQSGIRHDTGVSAPEKNLPLGSDDEEMKTILSNAEAMLVNPLEHDAPLEGVKNSADTQVAVPTLTKDVPLSDRNPESHAHS